MPLVCTVFDRRDELSTLSSAFVHEPPRWGATLLNFPLRRRGCRGVRGPSTGSRSADDLLAFGFGRGRLGDLAPLKFLDTPRCAAFVDAAYCDVVDLSHSWHRTNSEQSHQHCSFETKHPRVRTARAHAPAGARACSKPDTPKARIRNKSYKIPKSGSALDNP